MWFDALIDEALTLLACVSITMAVVLFIAGAALPARRVRMVAVLVLGMSVVGAVAGLAGGMSRVGVVGDIIPAALTLLGFSSLYLFGVKITRGLYASFAAAAFALALGLGYAAGAGKRAQADGFSDSLAFCEQAFGHPDIMTDDRAFLIQAQLFGINCMKIFAASFARTAEPRRTDDPNAVFDPDSVQSQYESNLLENLADAIDTAIETLELAANP